MVTAAGELPDDALEVVRTRWTSKRDHSAKPGDDADEFAVVTRRTDGF